MYNHEPKKYKCPLCLVSQGIENDDVYTKQEDIILKTKNFVIHIASHWWPNNPGHILITSKKHVENIYDMPDELLAEIAQLEKKIAIALKKAYGCTGVSTRQHNEPDGDQDVWHYHSHIFPRYKNDRLYENNPNKKLSNPIERKKYAAKLKKYL